uniref:Uncharacterized protein n=1 Tax=Rhizophora mucronata TaxID=61149 RepID=A0A2P2KP95_RHIMU
MIWETLYRCTSGLALTMISASWGPRWCSPSASISTTCAGTEAHFLRSFSILLSKHNSYLSSTNDFIIHALLCFCRIFSIAKLHKPKASWLPSIVIFRQIHILHGTKFLERTPKIFRPGVKREIANQQAGRTRRAAVTTRAGVTVADARFLVVVVSLPGTGRGSAAATGTVTPTPAPVARHRRHGQ